MKLQEECIGDACIVTAEGRLDAATCGAFADKLVTLIQNPRPKLLVDFAGVDLVTSAGLRAVLIIMKQVTAAGGAFVLCGVQDPVRDLFNISGFAGMLTIRSGRSDGLAALGR